MAKNVFFFIRAYNDMDIQASLMHEFAAGGDAVTVIGMPADGYVGAPQDHEAAGFLEERGVRFEEILLSPHAPFLVRAVYRMERWLRGRKKTFGPIVKYAHVAALQTLRILLGRSDWMAKLAAEWRPDIIVMDEVACQKGRSPIVDDVLPALVARGAKLYVVQTGQHVYRHANAGGGKLNYSPSLAQVFFVPAELDKAICQKTFPDEAFTVAGNLRMNPEWVGMLETLAREPFAPAFKGDLKIVLMLSKLSYGVERNLLIETIRALAEHPGVTLAIKPHTRGMKIDFLPDDIQGWIDVGSVPSPLLIDWADLTLVTGSGIVFHAMIRNKLAGILKYCQSYETIFDDGESCLVFEGQDDLLTLAAMTNDERDAVRRQQSERLKGWIPKTLMAGQDGNVAARYREIILRDAA